MGMPLKGATEPVIRDLDTGALADWLGLRIRQDSSGLAIIPGEQSWDQLRQSLERTHTQPDAPLRAIEIIEGWVGQLGPCFPCLDLPKFSQRIVLLAHAQACDELPSPRRIGFLLRSAYQRWESILKKLPRMRQGK